MEINDRQMGLWLLSNNLEMKMDHRFLIDTDAPMSMLGKGPNLYNQRVRSWDMAEHAYTARHVRALWQTRHRTIGGTLVLKWFQFYTVYCIFADWIRLPALVIAGLYDVRYLAVISLYVIWFQVLVLFLWEFLAFRKSSGRRARFAVILTFPVYKFGSIILRWLGMGMAYFVFLPNLTPPKTIPELEAELGPKLEECRELGKTLKRRVPIWLVDWHDEFGSYFRYYNPEEPTATDEQQPSEEESDSGFDIAVSPPTSFPDPPWGVSEHLVIGELSATEVKASTEILLVRHGGAVSAPRVRKLLQAHPAIATTQDHTGDYLIHTLSYADTPYDVLKVVAEFSDRSTINHKGESPLHLACKSGADFAIVELFGKKWPRTIKTSDYSGHFPLHLACANQTSVDVVQYLLMEYREAQSKVDQQGNLPLHAALMGVTSLDVIESLLEDTSSSPGLLHANTDGDLPLHLACVHPHAHSYVPVILRACPQAAEQPNAKGRLALHLACQSACPLEIFQEAGLLFMASLADKQGNTPLHLACHCRRLHQDNLRLLVEAAPHAVTTTNHKGELPLHLLCGAGSGPATDDEVAAALELLTDQPWSDTVLRIDEARRFPLHRACAVPSPRLVLVQTLLQKFPKAIFCRDCDQHTPLHLACQQTKVSVAVVRQLLRASGVDLTPSTGNKGDADKTDEREVDDEKDLQDENVPLAEPTLSQTSVHKNLRPNFSSEGSTFVDTGGGAWYRTIPLRDTPIHLAIRAGAAKEVVLLLKAALSQAREEANAEGETPRQLARRLRREGSRRRSRSREREHKSSRTDRLIGS
jgi:ankyrin repeat protein